jgi:hypothetical protein
MLRVSFAFFLLCCSLTSFSQVGIGTTSPTYPLSLGGNTSRVIGMERNTTASTAGNDLTILAGGATSGSSNLNGGNLVLSSGVATGLGSSSISFKTFPAGSSGTADNSALERMRILGSGKVGIGTSTPSTALHIENGNLITGGDPGNNNVPSIYLYNNNSSSTAAHSLLSIRTNGNGGGNPYLSFDVNGIKGHSMGIDNADAEKLKFYPFWDFPTASVPSMTMTTTGFVGIGTASPGTKLDIASADNITLRITSTTTDNNGMVLLNADNPNNWSADWHEFIYFQKQGTGIGAIKGSNNGAGVSYSTTSDYRLKTDYQNFNGLAILNKLKVYDYAWKSTNSRMFGFKAHELQEVVPYLVSGDKDEVDAIGKPVYQMVDYSKLTPILTKAVQEQQAEILELKKEIQELRKMLQEVQRAIK